MDTYKHRITKVLEENPIWCYYVHHRSQMNWTRASVKKFRQPPASWVKFWTPLSSQFPKFYQV